MEFNYVDKIENGIIIKDVINFELPHIFECGQCFRWNRQENGNYIGVAFGKVVEVEKKGNDVIIYNATEEDFEKIWCDYFDLDRDYSTIKEILSKDELLKKSVEFGLGIRILKQEPFEIVLSFIISANNRIPMIKRAIEKISKRWGKKVQYKDKDYYTFPSVEMLKECTIEELSECGMGFRAKYIKNTIEDIIYNELNLEYIKSLSDDDCHKELQKLSGVGPKVADCIMLFSMQKYSAFPVDVWVKRAMQHFYLAPDVSLKKIRDFGRNQFNPFCGFAQQYLFYYARENNIRV
ncbi:DNA-3-methyladenine glycosylase 2 family protein [Clostridium botulinum]|uniref:DNA-(apurinic or apyrimidinic site) lyase n=1 Tax=Clostridium botulinum C/D str. DC5 TaxID=1443128 RepID=A0A0A0IBT1_CLOBO|nr:DNA-3-methyladenine glycosylase [Clostridium botulinum]KEI05589.1 8-oxoguanine DNA glycosylase [Clostridium botulinum C/D str. BKT75002]KEI09656.1 8-oxoguanine DNA glycosylase [Clostridium botulinum C/D str. BKT2873]KGM95611.1 8-oxoguanine DNA glycosylase [Clostridium botulinum D str. CCUG 7971]KGM97781.1 8-oxoguanine DNA glycosylase [Clostridium botulinum C/D str. DC5]KOC49260.1 8-oxoguanine DNA glycosylase [Clostridium botulinum]